MEGDHNETIYTVDWAPTASDAAAAAAAGGTSGGGGGLGAACLATGAADNSLRVFYEMGEGDGAAFTLDVEVRRDWLRAVGVRGGNVLFAHVFKI